MANPVVVIAVIVVAALVIYAGYTYLNKSQASSTQPITQPSAPTTTPANSVQNGTSAPGNSLSGRTNIQYITIYENDFNGSRVSHYFSPSHFNTTQGRNVSVLVVNNGILPHNLEITGNDFNVSVSGYIMPGQNSLLNFTAPGYGNYLMISTHPGDQSLGFSGTMNVISAGQ